jgi:hypothetical protein
MLYRHEDGTITITGTAPKIIAVADDLIEAWANGRLAPGAWFSTAGAFGFQTSTGMLAYDIIGIDLFTLQWLAIRSDDELASQG